jgi:iron(III) transport system substrate-binding protein
VFRRHFAAGLASLAALSAAQAEDAGKYTPADPVQQQAGDREGELLVCSTTFEADASAMLAGFRDAFPTIRLDYRRLNSGALYDLVTAGQPVDLAWSSAFDLQLKLVNDGFAQAYVSPEAASLPGWAVWRHEAYGTTAEPVAIAYNKKLLPDALVPATHAAFTRMLNSHADLLQGKVATYDPERSGTGFLFLTQDVEITRQTWDLVRALGLAGVKLYITSDAMLDRVSAGEQWLAYNVIGSYALERAANDPAVGVILPSDYTLIITRFALIPRSASHPAAARLFLDYLLSRQGQARLASRSLNPVRDDVAVPASAAIPAALKPALRPVRVGPGVLTYLDRAKQARFLTEWRKTLQTH